MTRVFLVRHAEAEGNIFRRAHGQFNGQLIGRAGIQIERLKGRFENEKVDAVYSSDLSRTCMTAAAIYEPHGLPLIKTELLREVGMGEWEDRAWGELEHSEPEMSRFFSADPSRWRVRGCEEFRHVQERITDCITDIAKRHDGETVAAFSHGFAIRAFFCGLLGLKSSEIREIPYFDNTSVSLLLFDNGKLTIGHQGDNSHLTSDISTFANQTWWRGEKDWVFENLRYLPLDEERDRSMLEQFHAEYGKERTANVEYAAFLNDKPAGIVGLRTDGAELVEEGGGPGDNRSVGWIDYMYVLPGMRRRNYGIQLIGQAVSDFRRLRRERLRVEMPHGSADEGFLARFGFEKVWEHDGYCVMEKNIRNW